MSLKFFFSGESHGNKYILNIFGLPSGIFINKNFIYNDLIKRKSLFFSSNRTLKELDNFIFLNGLVNNLTTRNPILIEINNNIFSENINLPDILIFRPGHVDYSSFLKYKYSNTRVGAEFSSARNLIINSIVGSICKQILNYFNIFFVSQVLFIKNFSFNKVFKNDLQEIKKNCFFISKKFVKEKKLYAQKGDSSGGVIELSIFNIPPGLGSFLEKIESTISKKIFNIQSVKGLEFFNSFFRFKYFSSYFNNNYNVYRKKNIKNSYFSDFKNGLEGGMSTGFPVFFRVYFKQINTVLLSNNSLNFFNNKECLSFCERSDSNCILKSLVYLENIVSISLLDFFLKKFGSDNIEDIFKNFSSYNKNLRKKYFV